MDDDHGLRVPVMTVDGGYRIPLPPGVLYDGASLLDIVAAMSGLGVTVIVPDPWHAADAATTIADAGWRASSPPADMETINGWSAWTTYHKGLRSIHVGIRSMLEASRTPLFNADDEPATIARRLTDFQRITGVAYRMTPGMCGIALLRRHYAKLGAGTQPLWKEELPDGVRGIGDLIDHRPRRDAERGCRYVHQYDIHGAYLSAAGMADLAWTRLVQRTRPTFDPAVCGYWRIPYPSTHAPMWHPFAPEIVPDTRMLDDESVWVTTPIARLLVDHGARLDVLEAMTPEDMPYGGGRFRTTTRRVLRSWYERLRDARLDVPVACLEDDKDAMTATLKRVPNEAIGLMNPVSGRGAVVRSVWAWTVRDLNRANLLRKIQTTGVKTNRWPIQVKTDAVWYASDVDAGECAATLGISLPIGWRPGRWHYVDTTPAAEWTDPELVDVDGPR